MEADEVDEDVDDDDDDGDDVDKDDDDDDDDDDVDDVDDVDDDVELLSTAVELVVCDFAGAVARLMGRGDVDVDESTIGLAGAAADVPLQPTV